MEEDEERRELLQKIVDLLVEGGYFRARISSLLPFDKLTGGLAWCIIASNADIDFDFDLLFFDDEATLGEKIMVGEAIEAALQSMACPYPLQAHQIQGLDYQAVYPVVQWLVKRVLAMREELGDELQRFSHLQFEKYYQLPEEAATKQALQERLMGLSSISILQQPKRLYRQSLNDAFQRAPADRIHSTLLEYGLDINRSVFPSVEEEKPSPYSSTSIGIQKSGKKEENSGGRIGFHFSNIKTSDSAFSKADDALVSTSHVCQLFSLCKEEIQHAFTNYAFTHEDHGTWKQKAAILLREIENQEICIEQYKGNLSQTKNALEILEQNKKEQDQKNERVKIEVNNLKENVHKEGATSIVERLLSLLRDLKSLEEEELDFQRTTSEQMQAEIADLISQTSMLDENDEYTKIERILSAELSKLEAVRTELAKKHRAVALLQRQLDDIPSQTELVQFEHRFVELYEHIQARLRETRRYYGTYNALAEANELTLKETSLLNSINSQFEDAMMSASGRGKLLESMEGIAKGIQQKLGKMQVRFQEEQTRCNALKEKYGIALAEQRHYSALLKSFQDECARNERLRMELNGLNVTPS